MRKNQQRFTLIEILVVLAVVFILTVGGVVVWEEKVKPIPVPMPTPITGPVVTVGGPVAPGLSKSVKDLPTAAPIFITPFPEDSSKIQIILSKSIYQKSETITVSVKNTSSHKLGYEDCPGPKGGIVWFERKIGQSWEEEISLAGAYYWSKRPCYPEFLEAGQELEVSRHISTKVPSGTYRAVFHYVSGTVYSSKFRIL